MGLIETNEHALAQTPDHFNQFRVRGALRTHLVSAYERTTSAIDLYQAAVPGLREKAGELETFFPDGAKFARGLDESVAFLQEPIFSRLGKDFGISQRDFLKAGLANQLMRNIEELISYELRGRKHLGYVPYPVPNEPPLTLLSSTADEITSGNTTLTTLSYRNGVRYLIDDKTDQALVRQILDYSERFRELPTAKQVKAVIFLGEDYDEKKGAYFMPGGKYILESLLKNPGESERPYELARGTGVFFHEKRHSEQPVDVYSLFKEIDAISFETQTMHHGRNLNTHGFLSQYGYAPNTMHEAFQYYANEHERSLKKYLGKLKNPDGFIPCLTDHNIAYSEEFNRESSKMG